MKNVKRVGSLTKEQKALMPIWAAKWIEIGLRTGKTDWATFDKFMPICFEKAGLKYPKNIVRVSSPMVGGLAAPIAEAIWKKRRDAVGDAVDDAVGDAVGGAVDDAVGDAVRGAVRDAVGGAVRGAVRDAVGGAVGLLQQAIRLIKKLNLKIKWHYWLGGQFWVGYGWSWRGTAYVDFFLSVYGLKLNKDMMERAEAYRKVCESVNYIWSNRHFIMVCERPTEIHRNDRDQLHNEKGLAIRYPDGWGLYMIDGIIFDERIVMSPETITVREIQAEKNLEKQRVLIKLFGVKQYLTQIGATVLDIDMRGIEGGGARALMQEPNGNKWLVATDGSTDRVYHMAVDSKAETCRQAHESLSGFNETLIKMEG